MVTMENKIRKLINEGTPMVNTRIWSPWGTTAESAAASGSFDYLEFLAEYVPYDMRELENLVRACENQGVGSMLKVDLVWNLSDLFNSLMVIPNVLGLWALSNVAKDLYDDWKKQPAKVK